jgi:peptidoglycan/xylan/chitin deacetylase (PgdA/CDA1 family)
MRRSKVFPAFSLVALICVLIPTPSSAYVTVLLYHRFDGTTFPETNTMSRDFEAQMEYLRTNGYHVLSMNELSQCLEGKAHMPEKGVVITIDDGYLSGYEKAVPILKKYRYPFCMFVYTQAVGSKNYMSYEQLKEVRSFGGEVGCHSRTHPYLTDLPPDRIRNEIMGSKGTLEKNLGHPVQYFAYPFGYYDAEVRSVAKQAGFRLMLSSDPGSVGKNVERDRVPRQAIVGNNISIREFARKLENPPLEVSARIPGYGRLPSRNLSRIAMTIKNPSLYLPGNVSMFLSERGRLNTQFDPKTGVLTCNEGMYLTRNMNRIIVSAKMPDGRYTMDSYMVLLPLKNHQ